ncbi:hypothetical protein ZIOFF_046780 [Zingiber officinale]|uniref:GDSL esterase/lipase n=1 Tax=Zingiber officinale TaxID=94328 RepID=A0A8J5FTW2_ZINOF|nr:hypothetical protein ZIOFF_046780 [Zingiber officinale]
MATGLAWVTLLLLLLCAMATGDEGDQETSVSASFVFGDSLVDAGNNNYFNTLSKADMAPNGIDFAASGGEPTGRYTNGRTIADIIGELLGQKGYSPPFLAPNTTGSVILNGVNYASGGGGILNGTGRIFVNRLGLDIQLDYFNTTRQQLDELLGKSQAKEFMMKKSIFSVTIGSNDFLNNYLLPVLSARERARLNPDDFINELITKFRSQLIRLYTLDARKIVVANVGPIGCIPYQKTLNGVKENECVGLPNELAVQYNGQLRDLLAELNDNLPGGQFVLANVYDLVLEVLTNPGKYGKNRFARFEILLNLLQQTVKAINQGFKTSSYPCCGDGGQYQGYIPCGPTSSMCDDRSAYVFWDPYHPSEAANLLFAKYIVDGGTKYVSPMNLRQLVQL